jgi:hypothetical protein
MDPQGRYSDRAGASAATCSGLCQGSGFIPALAYWSVHHGDSIPAAPTTVSLFLISWWLLPFLPGCRINSLLFC